jgi:hypothetical protein
MGINYKTYVEKYPSGYSIRVTFGNENRLIDVSQDTMSNKTKAITYAKNLAKQNKGIYAGFKEMGQLSLFSNTKKKNTMAKSKKKAPAKRSAEDAKKIKSLRSQAAKLGQKLVAKKSSGASPVKYSGKVSKGNYRYKYIGGKK